MWDQVSLIWPRSVYRLCLIFAMLFIQVMDLQIFHTQIVSLERLPGFAMLVKWNGDSSGLMVQFSPGFPS